MKAITLFFFLSAFVHVNAQSTKIAAKAPADSFSINIFNAVKKIMLLSVNPKKTEFDLATEFVTVYNKKKIYFSSVDLPGSKKTFVYRKSTDWEKGISVWEWVAVMASAKKGLITNQLKEAEKKIDSILSKISSPAETDPKHHVVAKDVQFWTFEYSDLNDSLFITLEYTKPDNRIEQQMIDSITAKYRPGIFYGTSHNDAFNDMQDALFAENISKDKIQSLFEKLIGETADWNMETAFDLIMNVSNDLDYNKMIAGLSDPQKEQVKSMAGKIVKMVNDSQAEKGRKKDIETPKFKPFTQPAKIETKPRYAVGTSLDPVSSWLNKEKDYTVADYDPFGKKYRLAIRQFHPEKKTFFRTNDNVAYYTIDIEECTQDYLDKNFKVSAKQYEFCKQCKGTGAIYKTQYRTSGGEWEQLNFNVYAYSPGKVTAEWEERFRCPNCLGSGKREKK